MSRRSQMIPPWKVEFSKKMPDKSRKLSYDLRQTDSNWPWRIMALGSHTFASLFWFRLGSCWSSPNWLFDRPFCWRFLWFLASSNWTRASSSLLVPGTWSESSKCKTSAPETNSALPGPLTHHLHISVSPPLTSGIIHIDPRWGSTRCNTAPGIPEQLSFRILRLGCCRLL